MTTVPAMRPTTSVASFLVMRRTIAFCSEAPPTILPKSLPGRCAIGDRSARRQGRVFVIRMARGLEIPLRVWTLVADGTARAGTIGAERVELADPRSDVLRAALDLPDPRGRNRGG